MCVPAQCCEVHRPCVPVPWSVGQVVCVVYVSQCEPCMLVHPHGCEEAGPVHTLACTPEAPRLHTRVFPSSPQGAFSRCYKLTDLSTSVVFALKVVPRGGGGVGRLRPSGKVGPGPGPHPAVGAVHGSSLGEKGVCTCGFPGVPTRGRCPQVEREIALHSGLRHRNIVALHGHFADRDHVYMVLEYCGRQVRMGAQVQSHLPCPASEHVTCGHQAPLNVFFFFFLWFWGLNPWPLH